MPNPTVPCQYRTGKTLATGTYATLKEAIHIKTGKYYGCKVISKKVMQGREHLVLNEIVILKRAKGDNPNIVKLHDCFEVGLPSTAFLPDQSFLHRHHTIYICLDLCTGGTLFDRVRNDGTYSEAKAADLVHTILVAVKHIHYLGIEHRDLNPKTLHFRSPAESAPLVIADFGLSRMTEEAREGPNDGEMELYGVHRYMAPEVFLKPYHSKPVDVWGVGLLAFFMIAGCTPFEREGAQLETDAIVAGEYKFAPEEKWDNVTLNAREFISMCLTLDSDRRPTAGEALAHTWLVPSTPRVLQAKSRTVSLLELRLPYFKRVFNPKRKWRIVVSTIKALNRMRNLAGHPLPSTSQDVDES
ncbi:kinase-like domain-containing protein, partial [Mycena latifolia]